MGANPYTVVRVQGLRLSRHRAIAFLVSDSNIKINSKATFDALPDKRMREIMTRFDHWIDGGTHDSYFHGWPNDPLHKYCFVFKWKENKKHHRLYGFIFNPTPNSNPGFKVCVLFSHACKSQWETDPRELASANPLRC